MPEGMSLFALNCLPSTVCLSQLTPLTPLKHPDLPEDAAYWEFLEQLETDWADHPFYTPPGEDRHHGEARPVSHGGYNGNGYVDSVHEQGPNVIQRSHSKYIRDVQSRYASLSLSISIYLFISFSVRLKLLAVLN